MPKHPKTQTPNDSDLKANPLIGGSKGLTMGQASDEDLEALKGENTLKGDVENDTSAQGGINKAEAQQTRRRPHK